MFNYDNSQPPAPAPKRSLPNEYKAWLAPGPRELGGHLTFEVTLAHADTPSGSASAKFKIVLVESTTAANAYAAILSHASYYNVPHERIVTLCLLALTAFAHMHRRPENAVLLLGVVPALVDEDPGRWPMTFPLPELPFARIFDAAAFDGTVNDMLNDGYRVRPA